MKEYKKIEGVNSKPKSYDFEMIEKAKLIEKKLLDEGVEFKGSKNVVPWLVATEPFKINDNLKKKIERLGKSVYYYIDAIQKLYEVDKDVKGLLDLNVLEDLKGLDLEKKIQSFRLDIVVENNLPKITEVEEIYGNAGKMHAMQEAYGVNFDKLFEAFAKENLKNVLYDDTVKNYIPELNIFIKRMKKQCNIDVNLYPFSKINDEMTGTTWRFCYTKDFNQYNYETRQKIINANMAYINPLFNGYAMKSIFIPLYEQKYEVFFKENMGEKYYESLKRGTIKSEIINDKTDFNSLINDRKNKVIKVVDSPKNLDYNWGSRGVYFGDTAKNKWEKIIEYVKKGEIPFNPEINDVVFMVSELVNSDKYNIDFWDRENNCISTMYNARIRLGPIFFRNGTNIQFVAGHATFVNTSRKVHLGKHAVCAPIDL